jgi:Fungal N-terminal domain of STAND proteins
MDPLSIVASAIALFQAASRLGSLLGTIKPFLDAPNDVAALLHELCSVRNALEELQSTVTANNPGSLRGGKSLHGPIATCLLHVSSLEDLISKTCKLKETSGEVIMVDVKRAVWLRKKGEREKIKLRLRDALSALQLAIASLNL